MANLSSKFLPSEDGAVSDPVKRMVTVTVVMNTTLQHTNIHIHVNVCRIQMEATHRGWYDIAQQRFLRQEDYPSAEKLW